MRRSVVLFLSHGLVLALSSGLLTPPAEGAVGPLATGPDSSTVRRIRVLARSGKADVAERLARVLQGSVEKEHGPRSLHAAECQDLRVEARLQSATVDAEQTVRLAQGAVTLKRSIPGATAQDVAISLDLLGSALRNVNRLEESAAASDEALRLMRSASAPDSIFLARMEINSGLTTLTKGDVDSGAVIARRGIDLLARRVGPGASEVADCLVSLANDLDDRERTRDAHELYRRALAIRERQQPPDSLALAQDRMEYALSLERAGEFRRALELCEQALQVEEPMVDPMNGTLARHLTTNGMILQDLGRFAEADAIHRRVQEIYESHFGHKGWEVGLAIYNRASLYAQTGNYGRARPLFEESLALYRSAPDTRPEQLLRGEVGLAMLEAEEGNHRAADTLLTHALRLSRKVLGDSSMTTAWILSTLGGVQARGGRYAMARRNLLHARGLQQLPGASRADLAETEYALSIVATGTGDTLAALDQLRKAMAIREDVRGPLHSEAVQILQEIAELEWKLGNDSRAESLLTLATERFERSRMLVSEGERATAIHPPYELLAECQLTRGNTRGAWESIERGRGRVLADLLLAADARAISPGERAIEDSLKRAVQILGERADALDSDGSASEEARRQVHADLLANSSALGRLEQSLADRRGPVQGGSFPLARIQAALTDTSAIVGWLSVGEAPGRRDRWGYVVRQKGDVRWVRLDSVVVDPAAAQVAHQRLWRLLATLGGPRRADSLRSLSQRVWSLDFAPLESALQGITRMIVIPTGLVAHIPLESLQDSLGHYLCDRFSVSYAPSATIAAYERERPRAPSFDLAPRLLLVGDAPHNQAQAAEMKPDAVLLAATVERSGRGAARTRAATYGDPDALKGLPRLRFAGAEIDSIEALCRSAVRLSQLAATEQNVRDLVRRGDMSHFSHIHFACHALTDDDRPERSALILSQVGLPSAFESVRNHEPIMDGRVTAEEVVREWHLDADLVCLSACKTGLGRDVDGEGTMGLGQAFLQAGAHGVVVSQWAVDDRATGLLMKRFYQNLLNPEPGVRQPRMGKAAALDEARRWLREYSVVRGGAVSRPFADPWFWAPFVLIGED